MTMRPDQPRVPTNSTITAALLTGCALIWVQPTAIIAAAHNGNIVVAQAQAPDSAGKDKRPEHGREAPKGAEPRRGPPPQSQGAPQKPQTPGASTAQPPQKPATAQQPQRPQTPSTAQQPPQRPAPSTAQQPQRPQAPSTAQQPPQRPAPSTAQPQRNAPAPAAQNQNPAAASPPVQTRDAREFIRRDGQQPARKIGDLRQERRETREGNRVSIREGDRTIVRENNRVFIRHNEAARFAIDARNVRVNQRGANTETVVERANGVRIISITGPDGHLIRRLRRDASGREIVIIDNSFAGPRYNMFIDLPPPVIRIPRERYIVEAYQARPADIYAVFLAAPVDRIDRRYTVDQVRYSAPLRERMPRVDLDINFDTGSWQITPDQFDRLTVIADGLNRAIERNPREVFMIEGYTDAVGQDVDNLSLSDRRAESIAVALTEEFKVPAENLVTQGYGEQFLKVPTQGPERANRRVAVRRITPLIDAQAQSSGAR